MRGRVFIHTWDPPGGKQRVWYGGDIAGKRWPLSTPIDYEEWRLLKPHFFRRDNQSEFELTLRGDWERYHGGKDAWDWQLAMNCLCAVESIRRVHAMVLQSGWPHTHLVFVRPDVVLLNDMPLREILSLKADEAAIPSWGHNKGINDQFAAMRADGTAATAWVNRIRDAPALQRAHSHWEAEMLVQYAYERHGIRTRPVDFWFFRLRPNGGMHVSAGDISGFSGLLSPFLSPSLSPSLPFANLPFPSLTFSQEWRSGIQRSHSASNASTAHCWCGEALSRQL